MAQTTILISSTQSRNYGQVTQTYTAEMTVTVNEQRERQQAYKVLNILIAQEFAAFEGNFLTQASDNAPGGDEREWNGGILKVTITDGKTMHRLHTGKWQKYGIPVYSEVLPQFPEIPEGEFSLVLDGYHGVYQMSGSNPKRVLSCLSEQ